MTLAIFTALYTHTHSHTHTHTQTNKHIQEHICTLLTLFWGKDRLLFTLSFNAICFKSVISRLELVSERDT